MDELAFGKEHSLNRKLMEPQAAAGGGGGGGRGQVRRVHIVYFLSRNGRMEHPHLIRVHHLLCNGVRLRDVKRWLSKLRGKDMPESFAWSYKRRYKGGYVWQDLVEEDLITPISDNEYVLKGSQISSTLNNDVSLHSDKEVSELKKSSPFEVDPKDQKYPSTEKEYCLDIPTIASFEIKESPSFVSETSTKNTTKNQDEDEVEEEVQSQKDKNENNLYHKTCLNKNTNNTNNNKSKKSGNKNATSCFTTSPSPTYPFGKSSCFSSSRASHMFRNWISCRTVNTHEATVMVVNKRKSSTTSTTSLVSKKNGNENNMGQIYKEEKLGGFQKNFEGQNGSKKSRKDDSSNFKPFPAAYKPVNGPNCSQCGRQFKPEKLHTHMKYCRGMKALAKSRNPSPKPNSSKTHSTSTFYLTNN